MKQIQQSKLVNISPHNSLLNLLLKLFNVFRKIVNKVLITRNRNNMHRVQRLHVLFSITLLLFYEDFDVSANSLLRFPTPKMQHLITLSLQFIETMTFYSTKRYCRHARRTYRTFHSTLRGLRSVFIFRRKLLTIITKHASKLLARFRHQTG